ncbi:MAG: winged helix-turn-helix transcriptional regulator [Eggerthella lenta]
MPVEATIDIVGGKHKVLILWHLSKAGVLRFGELQRRMSQATPKMLTQQLRELEADGMVHRELYHQVPPKTEYSLTQRGVSFVPVLNAMCPGKGRAGRVSRRPTSEVLLTASHRAVCWATLYPPQREGTHEALQSSGSCMIADEASHGAEGHIHRHR